MKKFLSTKEASIYLGVSRRTLQRWIIEKNTFAQGEVIRVGGQYRITPEAVKRVYSDFSHF